MHQARGQFCLYPKFAGLESGKSGAPATIDCSLGNRPYNA